MDHAGTGQVGLREDLGHSHEIHWCRGVDVGVPGYTGAGRPGHVRTLDILLVILVAGQLLEEEIVQTVLCDQTLDGDDIGLDTLQKEER